MIPYIIGRKNESKNKQIKNHKRNDSVLCIFSNKFIKQKNKEKKNMLYKY